MKFTAATAALILAATATAAPFSSLSSRARHLPPGITPSGRLQCRSGPGLDFPSFDAFADGESVGADCSLQGDKIRSDTTWLHIAGAQGDTNGDGIPEDCYVPAAHTSLRDNQDLPTCAAPNNGTNEERDIDDRGRVSILWGAIDIGW